VIYKFLWQDKEIRDERALNTKKVHFGKGEKQCFGKIVWSAFHGRFKCEYLQLQKPYNNSTDGIVQKNVRGVFLYM